MKRLFYPNHPRVRREEDADALGVNVAALDLDQPDLPQFHKVVRQLPFCPPQRGRLHPEVKLGGPWGVDLLSMSYVREFRPTPISCRDKSQRGTKAPAQK